MELREEYRHVLGKISSLREEYMHHIIDKIHSLKQSDIKNKLINLLNSHKFEEMAKFDATIQLARDAMILIEIKQLSKEVAKLQKESGELEKKEGELK